MRRPDGWRPLTVRELAERLGLRFEGDGGAVVRDVAAVEAAGDGDLVFLADARKRDRLEGTRAAAAIVPAEPAGTAYPLPALRAPDPHLAFARAVAFFRAEWRPAPGVHPRAWVAETARLGAGVSVGPFCSIGEGVVVGDRSVLHPLVCLYPGVAIGADAVLHSGVVVREDCVVGDRAVLHAGAVIGADGFGFRRAPDGTQVKVPQVGNVVIEADVEIGANACVDRAALATTRIRRGAKIDDQVMVAHNVEIGEDAVLMAQTGVAGSSRVGRGAMLCGQVGVGDHIEIGDGAIAAAQSGVTNDVPPGTMVAGYPHLEVHLWRRVWGFLRGLPEWLKEYRALRDRVAALEKKLRDRESGR